MLFSIQICSTGQMFRDNFSVSVVLDSKMIERYVKLKEKKLIPIGLHIFVVILIATFQRVIISFGRFIL